MSPISIDIRDLDDLRRYVHHRLCDEENLEPGVFPMSERILTRRGQPCGIYFSLHGPRSVRLTAIWESERNSVLFYNSTGERFHKTSLMAQPCAIPCGA